MLKPIHARMARAALNWSLRDLEARTGINKNTLARFESGRGVLLSTAEKIEAIFRNEGVTFLDVSDARGFGVTLSGALVERALSGSFSSPKTKTKKRSQKAT